MELESRWYDALETGRLVEALRSLRRGDRTLLTDPELQQFLAAIDVEIGYHVDVFSAEVDRMIFLLPLNRQPCARLRHAVSTSGTSMKHLRSLMRLHCRLRCKIRGRTPRGRLQRDLNNLNKGSTSIRALLNAGRGSKVARVRRGRGRPLTMERSYRRELVMALRFGARASGSVDPDARHVLSFLDRDSGAMSRACQAVLRSWVLHEEERQSPLLEALQHGLLNVYEKHVGKPPTVSVYEPEGRPHRPGPALRFLAACVTPLAGAPTLDESQGVVVRYRCRSLPSAPPTEFF